MRLSLLKKEDRSRVRGQEKKAVESKHGLGMCAFPSLLAFTHICQDGPTSSLAFSLVSVGQLWRHRNVKCALNLQKVRQGRI